MSPSTDRTLALLRKYIVTDVETTAVRVHAMGSRWYDTRPMTDPREQPQEFVDLAVEALAVGQSIGALFPHPDKPHLVRVAVVDDVAHERG